MPKPQSPESIASSKDPRPLTGHTSGRNLFLCVILIIAAGAIVYSNSLNGEFVWDDGNLIVNNVYIRKAAQLPNIFTKSIRAGAGEVEGSFYRPIQMLTYFIDYSLWNINPRGYHLTNTLLHILVALSIFWLVRVLFDEWSLALFTGLLFVVHPIHTEAISYLSGRADPLVALFMILCFVFYIKTLRSGGLVNTLLMASTFVAALLSKEYGLILPVLLVVYHAAFKIPLKKRPSIILVGTALLYILFRLFVVQAEPSPEYPSPPLGMRIPGIFVSLTHYLRLMPFPFDLHMEYGGILFPWATPRAGIGLLVLIALLVYAFRMRQTHGWVFFSVYWFFAALVPYSNLYTLNAYMAEHWLYLPSLGFFLIVAKGLSTLYKTPPLKLVSVTLVLGLVIFYATLTLRQNRTWRTPAALYEHTLKYAPASSRLNSNLGIIYHKQGRNEAAIELFKRALALDPQNINAQGNLGNAYRAAARYEEAIALHKKVIALKPNRSSGYNNLGTVYFDMGRLEEAIKAFQKVIELNPHHDTAYNNLGLVHEKMGQSDQAIAMFDKANEVNPNYADPHYSLAIIYYNRGEHQKAWVHCERASTLGYPVNPELARALRPFGAYEGVKR